MKEQVTTRCTAKVIVHGRNATMKAIKYIDGVKHAEVWESHNMYHVPLSEVKYA